MYYGSEILPHLLEQYTLNSALEKLLSFRDHAKQTKGDVYIRIIRFSKSLAVNNEQKLYLSFCAYAFSCTFFYLELFPINKQ